VDDLPQVTGRSRAIGGKRRLRAVGQCQHDDETFLRRHQDVSIAEAVQHDPFEHGGGGLDRREPPPGLGERHLVSTGQVETEGLGSLDELA